MQKGKPIKQVKPVKQVKKEEKPKKPAEVEKLWWQKGFRSSTSSRSIFRYRLEDRETGQIRVLTSTPVSLYRHFVGGRMVTCSVNNCQFCAEGNTPSLKYLFLVIDRRKVMGSSGQVLSQDEVRVLEASKALTELLREVVEDPTAQDLKIKRIGKGTDTQYVVTACPKRPEPKVEDKKFIEEQWQKVLSEYEPPSVEEQQDLLGSEEEE